jgi:hypothetical protein
MSVQATYAAVGDSVTRAKGLDEQKIILKKGPIRGSGPKINFVSVQAKNIMKRKLGFQGPPQKCQI